MSSVERKERRERKKKSRHESEQQKDKSAETERRHNTVFAAEANEKSSGSMINLSVLS